MWFVVDEYYYSKPQLLRLAWGQSMSTRHTGCLSVIREVGRKWTGFQVSEGYLCKQCVCAALSYNKINPSTTPVHSVIIR